MGTGTKKKILIVEDETQISRFLQLELEHENYDCTVVADGEERRGRGGALGVQSYARQKLLYRKRLGHVIVRADIQPRHLVDDLIARRQYDNGRLPLLPEPSQDLYPVERR